MTTRLFAVLLACALLLVSHAARAHDARSAQVEIEALSVTDARVVVVAPPPAQLLVTPPDGCTFAAPLLHCPGGLAARELGVQGLGGELDLAFVRLGGFPDGDAGAAVVVTARAPRIALPGHETRPAVLVRFVRLGLEHVLSGLDHVLLLCALFWQAYAASRGALGKTARELARTATTFTVAHSLTLCATALGVLPVPAAVAEACIAFSLVLVALDLGRPRETLPSPLARVTLAAAFGLVHGLGFAGALAGTRLPSSSQWTALLAFNVGVELGQIAAFVALLVVVLAFRLRAASPHRPVDRLAGATAWVVGSVGSALFLLRVLAVLR